MYRSTFSTVIGVSMDTFSTVIGASPDALLVKLQIQTVSIAIKLVDHPQSFWTTIKCGLHNSEKHMIIYI